MFPWSRGRTEDFKSQYYWSQVRMLDETAIFSYNFLLARYFCSSKCPDPAVANFELMINSLMMNRVKTLIELICRIPSQEYSSSFKVYYIHFITCLISNSNFWVKFNWNFSVQYQLIILPEANDPMLNFIISFYSLKMLQGL